MVVDTDVPLVQVEVVENKSDIEVRDVWIMLV